MDKKSLYNTLLNKTGVCILFTIIGMLVGIFFIPPALALLSLLFILGAFIALLFMKNNVVTMTFDYGISLLMGIGISPSISHYIGKLGLMLVLIVFIATCLISLGLSFVGYISKKDFSIIELILFISLIVLIIGGILNLFLHLKMLHLILTIAGIFIFSIYIVVDMNMALKEIHSEEDIPLAVMNLYLDFINLLLNILELISEISGDDD